MQATKKASTTFLSPTPNASPEKAAKLPKEASLSIQIGDGCTTSTDTTTASPAHSGTATTAPIRNHAPKIAQLTVFLPKTGEIPTEWSRSTEEPN